MCKGGRAGGFYVPKKKCSWLTYYFHKVVLLTVDKLFLFILQHTAIRELKIIYFTKLLSYFITVHKHIGTFVLSCREFNDSSAKEIKSLALVAIYEQQFPLPRYCGVCELGTNATVCSEIILEK
jgi:hypothetical protein